MNEYPPGEYVGEAMKALPPPAPDVAPHTVVINAGEFWGRYQVTFVAKRNPRQGMRSWFWTVESGQRLDLPD